MPLPALLAVAALAGAATLSSRAQAGSRARMTVAQAAAHKARLVELLLGGRWRTAIKENEESNAGELDLSGADFHHARITDANLSRANLTDANLSGANLANTNLSGADLSGADLSDADLSGADLADADLTDAYLEEARLPDGFLAPGTRLDAVPWVGTPSGWKAVASPRGARFFPLSEA